MRCGQGQGSPQTKRKATRITPGQHISPHRVALSPCSSSDCRNYSRTSTTTSITSRKAFNHGLMCGVLLRRIRGCFALLHNVYFAMLAIGCGRRKDAQALHEKSIRHGAGRPSRGVEPSPHPSRLGYTNDGSTAYRYVKPSVAMLHSKLVLRYAVTL